MLGELDFSDEKLQDTTGVLPPKKQAKIIPENWEPPNHSPFPVRSATPGPGPSEGVAVSIPFFSSKPVARPRMRVSSRVPTDCQCAKDRLATDWKHGRNPSRAALQPKTISARQDLVEAGKSVSQAAKHLGIGRSTAYKAISEVRQRQMFAESSPLE